MPDSSTSPTASLSIVNVPLDPDRVGLVIPVTTRKAVPVPVPRSYAMPSVSIIVLPAALPTTLSNERLTPLTLIKPDVPHPLLQTAAVPSDPSVIVYPTGNVSVIVVAFAPTSVSKETL